MHLREDVNYLPVTEVAVGRCAEPEKELLTVDVLTLNFRRKEHFLNLNSIQKAL